MKTTTPPEHAAPRMDEPRGDRRGRAGWYIAAAILGVAVLVAALVWWVPADDDNDGQAGPTSTTAVASTTTTSPSAVVDPTVMWPFPGSTTTYATPTEAATSFARSMLRFAAPVAGDFQQGDSRSGEVPIRPRAGGPVTTVFVRQVGSGSDWSVLGAATDTIDVTSPATGDEISSPVKVAGRAVAFEGVVNVEVREDGALGAIGEGVVMGGGDVMRPFEGSISFETAGAPYGALVFFTESAENGEVWQAAAMRIALRSTDIDAVACGTYRSPRPQLQSGQMEVKAYFTCDASGNGTAFPVYRAVPSSSAVLRASLAALLAGPNAAEADVLDSWFSSATRDLLRSVVITDGHAIVDFGDLRPVIPNASASAGSAMLLSELDATVFQFSSVTSVEYRINGSCTDFSEWLQYGGCEPRTRDASAD